MPDEVENMGKHFKTYEDKEKYLQIRLMRGCEGIGKLELHLGKVARNFQLRRIKKGHFGTRRACTRPAHEKRAGDKSLAC